MQNILFVNHDRKPVLKNKKQLKAFIKDLFGKEKRGLKRVLYVFCSDEYLLGINKTYLKHNYYTDVISFNLSASPKQVEAEIYISIDRVKDNARTEGVSVNEELHRVIFHGALHFCGYNDKKRGDAERMKKREDKYIKKYNNI